MISKQVITEEVLLFLKEHDLFPEQVEWIQAGRNSRVWCIESNGNPLALKEYFWHPHDRRDRLGSESRFLSFLQRHTNLPIPQVIVVQKKYNLGLYSWLLGNSVKEITEDYIEQCAKFIALVNECRL